ncbi:hypothetical protein AAG570_001564 [Ranatra chinensis]|uniref:Uncharacterized protein n=1 Tax=Ranatra chinensis TaxID=642074 RepID=A0ABD0Y8W8_9HEMI
MASKRRNMFYQNRKQETTEIGTCNLPSFCDCMSCRPSDEATGDGSADPVQLRKALEWELSLDCRDLRSHAWYHGAIPRGRAEEIVRELGQFLVRDCTSQPGNYVLTCRTPTAPLHFVISKVVIQPDTVYERVQYQFEDEPFDTVPDLITYYVGSGKPVTTASRAKITTPCTRMYPLSFYATKYGIQNCGGGGSQRVSPLSSPLSAGGAATLHRPPSQNSAHSPAHSPPRTKREVPPRLPCKKQKSFSQADAPNGRAHGTLMTRSSIEEKSNSADGVILDHMTRSVGPECPTAPTNNFSTHSLPRRPSAGGGVVKVPSSLASSTVPRNIKMSRVTSDPALSPSAERKPFVGNEGSDYVDGPPPKPSMRPLLLKLASRESQQGFAETEIGDERPVGGFYGHGGFQRVVSYHASGSDSGNGSGDSAQSSAAGDVSESCSTLPLRPGGVIIRNPRYYVPRSGIPVSSSSTTLKAYEYDSAIEDTLPHTQEPNLDFPSCYDLENFQTLLLPTLENKPLDPTVLDSVRMRLHDTGSRILANHLTRMDLELTLGVERCRSWDDDVRLGVGSCIELAALPFGHQMRLDLIERTICLKLLVAVTILTCQVESERAETLNKWIQVAIDTKTALGNLFGFNAVMLGLCVPQIQRLTVTWHIMRQKFTDSAFNFEAKLRPTLKSMNECTNPQAPNTTIPHLLPYLLLQDRGLDDMKDKFVSVPGSSTLPTCIESNCISAWESTAPDFGLGTLFAHLDSARKFTDSVPTYRRNAEIVLGDTKVDDLLLDMFRTEFHLKFLWGSRGASRLTSETNHLYNYAKFDEILTALSRKCEPPQEEYMTASTPAPYNPAIGTSV